MAIQRDVFLKCDSCGETAFPSHTAKQARAEARSCEWVYIKGKDYCPKCKPANKVILKRFGYQPVKVG